MQLLHAPTLSEILFIINTFRVLYGGLWRTMERPSVATLRNYESEGRTFESFRARHFLHKIQKDTRISRGRPRLEMRFSRGFSRGIFLVVGLGFFASPPGGRPQTRARDHLMGLDSPSPA